jgi:hypothetical protein
MLRGKIGLKYVRLYMPILFEKRGDVNGEHDLEKKAIQAESINLLLLLNKK